MGSSPALLACQHQHASIVRTSLMRVLGLTIELGSITYLIPNLVVDRPSAGAHDSGWAPRRTPWKEFEASKAPAGHRHGAGHLPGTACRHATFGLANQRGQGVFALNPSL